MGANQSNTEEIHESGFISNEVDSIKKIIQPHEKNQYFLVSIQCFHGVQSYLREKLVQSFPRE